MSSAFMIRLPDKDRRLFNRAAKAAGLTVAEWLRRVGREKATQAARRPVSLDLVGQTETWDYGRDQEASLKRKIHGVDR